MDFPSNSHNIVGPKKEKPPKEAVQKVVEGAVIQKPKSISRKFKSIFFGGEAKSAVSYVFVDVLIPAFKNMVVDATSKGVERVIYGESSPRRGRSMLDQYRPRISYNQPIERGYPRSQSAMLPDQPPIRDRSGRRPDSGEIILVSRADAEQVLERLGDIIEKYDVASVADLHELVGLPTTYVDNKWGWSSINYAEVRQIRDGFLLNLPQAEPI